MNAKKAMKVSKKLLSVLLAVVMIMSSMSVCFGTITFAANDTGAVNAFISAMKCDAMKSFTTTSSGRTFTYTAPSYAHYEQVSNVIAKLDAAIKGLDEYKNNADHNGNQDCADAWYGGDKCTDLGWVEKYLKIAIGDSELATLTGTYNLTKLFAAVFNMSDLNYRNADTQNTDDKDDTPTASNVPETVTNTLTVTTTKVAEKLLAYSSIAAVPENVETTTTYTLKMFRQNFVTKDGCDDVNHYHIAMNIKKTGGVPTITKGNGTTNKGVLTGAEDVFTNNAAYISAADVNGILALSENADALALVKEAIETAKNSVIEKHSEAVYNHFFDEVAIDAAIKNISDAIEFLGFKVTVDELNRLNAINYDSYTEEQLLAHLSTFEAEIAKFDALEDATKQLIITSFNLDIDGIKATCADVRHDYEVIGIARLKVQTDTHINMYQSWNIDDVDEGRVTSDQLTTAIGSISNDFDLLGKYVQANVAEVCGATYMTDLATLKGNLTKLGAAAGYNDQFLKDYAKYRDEIKNAIDVESAELLASLQAYDVWYAGLKGLINSMVTELGQENADKLFDELNEPMVEYIDNAYIVLNERTESDVNTAYELFTAYTKANGKDIHMATVSDYKAMRNSIGLINVDALNFLVATPNFEFNADLLRKYNEMKDEFPAYAEFLESKGFSTYQTSTIGNIVREDTTDDVARENEDIDKDGIGEYVADDAKIENVIKVLDAAITNGEVGKILGGLINKDGSPLNLGTMLNDLVKGAIMTDSFINTVVEMLYPLVLSEFIKVWANDLPSTADNPLGGTLNVTYVKTLDVILDEAGFPLYPHLLAKRLDSGKYKANIETLNAASSNFLSEFGPKSDPNDTNYYTLQLIDEFKDDGTQKKGAKNTAWDSAALKKNVLDEEGNVVLNDDGTPKTVSALTWGVDDAKKAVEAGTMTQADFETFFYNAFDDAVEGLKPLLLAIIANKAWNGNTSKNMADAGGLADVDLDLSATANRGYANLLVPIYEALGVPFDDPSVIENQHIKETNDVAAILRSILTPIFTLIDNIGKAPLDTILGILPNVFYALSAQMVNPLLSMLKTSIAYKATPKVLGCSWIKVDPITGPPANVDVGSMLNLADMGVDLSDGINSVLKGFGLEIPAINQGLVATLGELTTAPTKRGDFVYAKPSNGQAYTIKANKADVLLYLLDYVFALVQDEDAFTGLLGMFMTKEVPGVNEDGSPMLDGAGKEVMVKVPDEDKINELINTLTTDFELFKKLEKSDDMIAAIVELLNQKKYDTLENYEWFNGYIDDQQVGTPNNVVDQFYLNPENDWTEEKAQYIYDNIDEIVAAVLKMANVDLDATTEEVDGSVEDFIAGVFSAKTLTSIARLLGSLSDIGALLNKEEAPAEGEDAPETVAEGEEGEEAAGGTALDLDINALIKEFLDVDLATAYGAYAEIPTAEEDPDYVYDFGTEITNAKQFAAVLADMLAPIAPVLGFILDGKDLEIKLSATQKVKLVGYNGYDNAIVPVLEALGCDVEAHGGNNALALTLAAIAGKVDAIINKGAVKGIIDILPGLFYFLAGNNLATVVRNLLQPVYVILDTIRPIIDIDLDELLAGIEINGAPLNLDLDVLNLNFVFDLVPSLLPEDLDLGTLFADLKQFIYDACKIVGTEYKSVSKLAGQTTWKRGAYSEDFKQADMITIILSFLLDWATIPANGAKLDALLGTDGIVANISGVFADIEINYDDPNWMHWFETEEEWNKYLAGEIGLDKTVEAITYPAGNDWDRETAEYFANNIDKLVDAVIAMINTDENAPKTLEALLEGLVYGDFGITVSEENGTTINYIFSDETINTILGMLKGFVAEIDEALLGLGYLINVDLVGLLNYTCEKEIKTLDAFLVELGYILDTYAKGIIDLLFFGDDLKLAKKSDGTDTIVINGGKGYEMGLALILEALGCDVPTLAEASAETILGALGARAAEILADPVGEILDMLPNLVYFLNANGAGVALNNILQPVYAIVDKINGLGVLEEPIVIADLLKIKKDDGTEVGINPAELDISSITALVGTLTGLDLSSVKDVLDNFYVGKIVETEFGYKMTDVAREDIITILLVVVATLIEDDAFTASLDSMLETEIVSAIKDIINIGEPTYSVMPEYDYTGIDGIVGEVLDANLAYPEGNNWTEEKAEWIVNNLPAIADAVISMVEINGVKYENLSALLASVLADANIFTTENLKTLVELIAGLLEDIDNNLLEAAGILLNVDIVGLKEYKVPEGIATFDAFAAELAKVLNTYAKGLVEWLFLGRDYKFLAKETINGTTVSYVTIQGTYGYAEGLAPILEALGCANLPVFYGTDAKTEDLVNGIFASIAARIDEIIANPVVEVVELLPALIYFLNANGVAVAIDNLTAGIAGLLDKLSVFGLDINLNEIVNLKDILKTNVEISLDDLKLATLIDVAAEKTGLDLSAVKSIFVDFALGEVYEYESVSNANKYLMRFTEDKDAGDMLTAIIVAVLITALDTEGNAEVIAEMVGSDIIGAIDVVINDAPVSYGDPNWYYCADENGNATGDSIPVIESAITYPNDWSEEKVEKLANDLPKLVDTVIAMINTDENAPKTLAALLQGVLADANIFSSATLESLVGLLQEFLVNIDDKLLEAGMLLNVDIVGLKAYKVPADIDTVDEFAAEFANILSTYAEGIVDWLLLGEDYKFFVDVDANTGAIEDYITINGAHGYAKGLALILEALGCKNLPKVDFVEDATNDTTAIVKGVFDSIADRIDEIIANPVEEVINLLPNLIYFLNTNGVAVAVDNTIAAIEALLLKLKVFGITTDEGEALTLAGLVDLKALLELPETAKISVNNLTLEAIIEVASIKTGLDLSVLNEVLAKFALGKLEKYDSVSGTEAYKMVYANKFDKADMITVLFTAVLLTAFETEGNAEVLAEMLGVELLTAIEDVFNDKAIVYGIPEWYEVVDNKDNFTQGAVIEQIMNPENWTNEDSAYLSMELPGAVDKIVAMLTKDDETIYTTLSSFLNAKVNVFTTENLQAIADMIAELLINIDDELLNAAGLILDIDVAGLKYYKAPEGITTVDAFAAELANILNTYAKGIVEWLLLGKDFRFFVKDVIGEEKLPVDFVTINGAHGYAEGLALILEALGCKNLPEVYDTEATTEEIVAGVLASVAARINEIFANPVNEIIDMLPDLLYFINANGLSVAVNNTVSALTALLAKLENLGVKLDLNELVNIKALLDLPETAKIGLDNLTMEAVLEVVTLKVEGLDITHISDILVNFALGQLVPYDSVSANKAYKMIYRDFNGPVMDTITIDGVEYKLTQGDIDRGNMLTVIANAVVLVLADEDNFDFFMSLFGEEVMLVIVSLFDFKNPEAKPFEWWNTEAANTGKIFSAFESSDKYKGDVVYGEFYTQEMSQYIADNFEEFVNNIIYLLGIDVNGDGEFETNLTSLINGLINGNLYNSANVVAIRDALYGALSQINNIEVNGMPVGRYIKMVLKLSKIADIDAIGAVQIAEFTENKEAFVAALCDVLEPITPVLKFVLADEDFKFFKTVEVDEAGNPVYNEDGTPKFTDAITIRGAEGYAYGIIPLLELLECEDIMTRDEYYAAVEADNGVLLTSILNPLLDRVDEIVANPAEEILDMLPNIIYFVNSNGVDTVVKNTLNAVFAVLEAISPIAKIDLYEIFGVDLATIDFNWIVDKVVELLGNQGYSFSVEDIMAINELTVGTIVSYESANGETAYKMVYSPNGGIAGGKAEMITVIERLVITFIADKKNQKAVVDFLEGALGMGETGKKFVEGTIEVIAGTLSETNFGMQISLAAVYYLFYGLDIGAGETVNGLDNLNKIWSESIQKLKDKVPVVGGLLDKIFDIDGMDDIISEEGLATNGFIAFFQRIADFFQRIVDWFKNLFSFNFLKK